MGEIHQFSERVGSTASAPTPAVNMTRPRLVVLPLPWATNLVAGNIIDEVEAIAMRNMGSR
jgi:hypothetical protein